MKCAGSQEMSTTRTPVQMNQTRGTQKRKQTLVYHPFTKNQIYEMQAECKYIIKPLFQRKKLQAKPSFKGRQVFLFNKLIQDTCQDLGGLSSYLAPTFGSRLLPIADETQMFRTFALLRAMRASVATAAAPLAIVAASGSPNNEENAKERG